MLTTLTDHEYLATDRVLFFDHGKLLEDASPAEFFDAPKDPRARAFLKQVL